MKKKGQTITSVQPVKKYSESFKRMVVKEYEKGLLNKDQIQVKWDWRQQPSA